MTPEQFAQVLSVLESLKKELGTLSDIFINDASGEAPLGWRG